MSKARVIHKFSVPLDHADHTLQLPGGTVCCVGAQGATDLFVWVEYQPSAPIKPSSTRTFRWYATGQPIDDDAGYCGTVHSEGFVWHLYERNLV